MANVNQCPRCGVELSPDNAQGLCPKCLLQVGMESNTQQPSSGDMPTESFAGGIGVNQAEKHHADLPHPGEQFGNYRLVSELGRGGMGAVFEADDLESGRRVALKVLAHSLESTEARNRFFREGRLAASINHPNSVYIYGTEEIEGTPAISMEHIAGGTLQYHVAQGGPLPTAQAVDAIMQIIEGLEAAAAAGVLHRDVKPSNCFIDSDGTVKIGDFGLSISTTVRGDSHLTQPGSFLGTPAFASPEQLRGDELDVRSDIYAVGVTLYYLLTGRTPYQADNMVKLLATVLEQPAPSPIQFRPDIPKGLANLVLRCLAKQPSDRFRNYADLRDALTPYNSVAPTPATLALRFAAGLSDHLIWQVAVLGVQLLVFWRDVGAMFDPATFASSRFVIWVCIAIVLHVCYFAVPEGLWGASLGKAMWRLRVVNHNRNPIGMLRAFARTLIYVIFPSSITWAYWIFSGFIYDYERAYELASESIVPMLVGYSYFVLLAVLFSTARRSNGYSGLHDVAVGARVILRTAYQARPTLGVEEKALPDIEGQETIGPYHVLDTLGKIGSSEFLLGYDTRLLRRVWIHRLPVGSPPVGADRRRLGRIGRLRWINGCRDDDQCWDVYEALSGQPLQRLLDKQQPWSVVRHWLLDLAHELNVSNSDGTTPDSLKLDRVWITAEGRAKLLDFPGPTTQDSIKKTEKSPVKKPASNASVFLHEVANAALHGITDAHKTPLPLDAGNLLQHLSETDDLDEVCTELKQLVSRTPKVTKFRRAAMFAATAALPIFFAIFSAFFFQWILELQQQHPAVRELQHLLMCWDANNRGTPIRNGHGDDEPTPDEQREAIEVYIAGNFRDLISDPKRWNSFIGLTIPHPHRKIAEQIIAERPVPKAEELAAATTEVAPIFEQLAAIQKTQEHFTPIVIASLQFTVMWIMLVSVPGLIAAVAFRRGLIMLMFGVHCVTRRGVPASRLRMLWRTIVFNAPIILGPIALALIYPVTQELTVSILLIVGVMLMISIGSLLLPIRGLSDRLAGTYLVPK